MAKVMHMLSASCLADFRARESGRSV